MEEAPNPHDIILDELKKESPDWRLIERLSRDAVDADPTAIRFSVDAGHIQRLGLELVAKQETALAELIKNAYDADATEVRVTFANHDKPDGTLTIEDNGVGMTTDVVRDAWMRISTTSKRDAPVSQRYGRHRAGKKGIGRFAVQRLGNRLIMETEVAGNGTGLRVTFDWDREFQAGRNLHDVFSVVEEYEKPLDRERTRLSILGLRETWSEATLQRVWRAVLLLLPPFPISRRKTAGGCGHESDPGFDVVINGVSSRMRKTELSIDKGFLDHALADITGTIDDNGAASVTVRSKTLGIDEGQQFDERFLLPGRLHFTAKYFIFSSDTMPGLSLPLATEMSRIYGGIRIYRNGFRVPPYGELTDDWLRLEFDAARRLFIFPLGNRSLFGQVELNDEDNILFEETSSREGLIENEAFEQLRIFVRKSVEWAANRIAAVRQRKQTSGQKGFVSKARPPRNPTQVLGSLLDTLGAPSASTGAPASGDGNSQPLPSDAQAAVASALAELERYEEQVAASALTHSDGAGRRASLARMVSAGLVQTKGLEDRLCSLM